MAEKKGQSKGSQMTGNSSTKKTKATNEENNLSKDDTESSFLKKYPNGPNFYGNRSGGKKS